MISPLKTCDNCSGSVYNFCTLGFLLFTLFVFFDLLNLCFFWFIEPRRRFFWTLVFLSFSSPFLAFFKMARTKTTSNPPPSVDYKALYPWAFADLLAETSKLTFNEDVRKHWEEEADPKCHVFGREIDAYVSIRPCAKGEPVCADDRANAGEPLFFLYATIFKQIKSACRSLGLSEPS